MRINSLTLAVLIASVAAVPHRRHAHPHPVRRDNEVVTTSVVDLAMAVLYVDQNGNPVATSLQPVDAEPTDPAVDAADDVSPLGGPPSPYASSGYPQSIPTPSSQDSSSDAPYTAPPETTQAPPRSTESTSDTSSSTPPQSASPDPEDDDGEIVGYSIAYAPYNADHSCKSEAEVNTDIDHLHKYDMVRIYGTDCGQVPLIMTAAKRNNMKVMAGIWNVNNAAAEAQLIVDGAKDEWSRIHSVSVGNEVLTNGISLGELTAGIGAARSVLKGGGFTGDITTVEVYSTLWERQYAPLCDVIDYVAVNCHPYFDAEETPENAGNYVQGAAARLKTDFCDKTVVITESGWPTAGMTNGKAVPSLTNQQTAIRALHAAYSNEKEKLILFSAYNDPWKPDNKYGVEHFWGIYGTAPSAR